MAKSNKSLISVIIPFYNVEAYASKCIESVINQTYRNLEIILVDDGSPDNCGKIIDEYAKKDKRIKVIHKKNGGLSDARNKGIEVATGKYIGFVDSDDYIKEDMYEYLHNLIIDNDADIAICGVLDFYEDKELVIPNVEEDIKNYNSVDAIKELLLDNSIRSHAWDKLYKRELFTKDCYYPKGKKMEDIATTYKLFEKAKKVVVSNVPKYYYLQRSNGIMLSKSTGMWIDYYELSLERYKYIKDKYPEMIENDISLLILIMYLYDTDNKDFIKYLKDNKVKQLYNKLYNFRMIKSNISNRNIRIRLFLLRINITLYRYIMKIYKRCK